MLLVDSLLLAFTPVAAFSIRFGEWYFPLNGVEWLILASPIIAIPVFFRFGLYRSIMRYIEFRALWVIAQAVSLYALIWGVAVFISGVQGVPRSVIIINGILALLLVGGSRVAARALFSSTHNKKINPSSRNKSSTRKNVVIYGSGEAGIQLASALLYSRELCPVAFVDDAPSLVGLNIKGLKVYSADDLPRLTHEKKVSEVLLAMPSASRHARSKILEFLEALPVLVRTLPGVAEMAQGQVRINDLREVSIDDLLTRDSVQPNVNLLKKNIQNQVVMVTGAGGSIGSELCRQILKYGPACLILFEQNEYSLYAIEKELNKAHADTNIIPLLGSVMHQNRVEHICRSFGVQTIYHSAAYKHVPLVEYNPIEAVQNNIFGTLRAARGAISADVENFVLISTDKAVRPTNVMGATKRFAELVLQALAAESKSTRFSMVRFGNVLGSSGSVVPHFHQQVKEGGPVTVTHPEITRYFMTIPEAAQLVIQAGAMANGGDVFVLDMGDPVKIIDLAIKVIHLSGLTLKDPDNCDGDIEIKFTGLRPGEKLYEELLIGDNVVGTDHPLIMRAREEMLDMAALDKILDALSFASHNFNPMEIRSLLMEAISGYNPQCELQDLTFCHNEKRKGRPGPKLH